MATAIQHGEPCPECNKKLTKFAWHSSCYHCGANFAGSNEEEQVTLKPGQKQYFVVTQADQWWMGKFSPDRMAHLLNRLAAGGWSVVAVAAADRGTWFGSLGGGTRQEMVVFLERTVEVETIIPPRPLTIADVL